MTSFEKPNPQTYDEMKDALASCRMRLKGAMSTNAMLSLFSLLEVHGFDHKVAEELDHRLGPGISGGLTKKEQRVLLVIAKRALAARDEAYTRKAEKAGSAWTKGLENAPHDKVLLVRNPNWIAPVVVKWVRDERESYFGFLEELLSDVCGCIIEEEYTDCEWTVMPE